MRGQSGNASIAEGTTATRVGMIHFMSSKLAKTNPYLRDPVTRERIVLKSVASSSAIEGIRAPFRKTAAKAKSASIPAKKKG